MINRINFKCRPRLRALLLNIFFSLLPIFIVFVLYLPVLAGRGIAFYGDNTYYAVGSKSFYSDLSRYFFPIGTIPLTLFSYAIPLNFLALLLGPENGVKAFILLVCSLSGTLTYFAIKILGDEFFTIHPSLRARFGIFKEYELHQFRITFVI